MYFGPRALSENASALPIVLGLALAAQHGEEGAFGLVVNRPVLTSGRIVVNLDPPVETEGDLEVWVGGPVEPERSWILVGEEPLAPALLVQVGARVRDGGSTATTSRSRAPRCRPRTGLG